ncbi:MAG: ATP-binding cassette domain-containing protein [Pseudomonadota bacterium]
MLTLDGVRFARPGFTLEADVTIATGARVAVIGPSGGGKSTLLSLIAGFEVPQAGRVTWDGTDLLPLAPGERPLSMLFQDTNLFPHLTVAQNVGLGIDPSLRLSPAQRGAVAQVLSEVGLPDISHRKPGALSGGQRARVALARALLRERPLLLLDEAFSALGPALKAEMFELLNQTVARIGATLLIVTHDPEEAARMDQIIVVDGGRADPPEDASELLANPSAALRTYLGRP